MSTTTKKTWAELAEEEDEYYASQDIPPQPILKPTQSDIGPQPTKARRPPQKRNRDDISDFQQPQQNNDQYEGNYQNQKPGGKSNYKNKKPRNYDDNDYQGKKQYKHNNIDDNWNQNRDTFQKKNPEKIEDKNTRLIKEINSILSDWTNPEVYIKVELYQGTQLKDDIQERFIRDYQVEATLHPRNDIVDIYCSPQTARRIFEKMALEFDYEGQTILLMYPKYVNEPVPSYGRNKVVIQRSNIRAEAQEEPKQDRQPKQAPRDIQYNDTYKSDSKYKREDKEPYYPQKNQNFQNPRKSNDRQYFKESTYQTKYSEKNSTEQVPKRQEPASEVQVAEIQTKSSEQSPQQEQPQQSQNQRPKYQKQFPKNNNYGNKPKIVYEVKHPQADTDKDNLNTPSEGQQQDPEPQVIQEMEQLTLNPQATDEGIEEKEVQDTEENQESQKKKKKKKPKSKMSTPQTKFADGNLFNILKHA